MMSINYPPYMPNLSFIVGILSILAINYYINLRKIPDRYKYGFTIICLILLILFPIPFFAENRLFGSVPTGLPDYRSYPPFTLVGYIIVLLKYYSVQMNAIKSKGNAPGIMFVMTFLLLLPHYVQNYGPEGLKAKDPEKAKKENLRKAFVYFGQFVLSFSFIIVFFAFIDMPWNIIASCLRGFTAAIPLIMGSGIVVIAMFVFGSSIFSFVSAYYNALGGHKFKFYQDKAFMATSVGEFWRRWNLWGNEWFTVYMYKPLRRKLKLTHTQASLAIFAFSGLIHAYIVALINYHFAWLTFFVFFINGVVVSLEKPAVKKFPFISALPKWLKFILTLLFLDITLGLFGLCFTKWP